MVNHQIKAITVIIPIRTGTKGSFITKQDFEQSKFEA